MPTTLVMLTIRPRRALLMTLVAACVA